MKTLLALFLCFLFLGCSYSRLINKIPPYSFDSFSWHRAGNITSADIEAKNSSRDEEGNLIVEEVKIKTDYGPAWNLNVQIQGLIILQEEERR